MKFQMNLKRTVFAAIVAGCIGFGTTGAKGAVWISNGSGNWNDGTKWDTNPLFPNGQDEVASLTLDISATRTVTIPTGVAITIGTLNIGDTIGTSIFNIAGTGTGSLSFSVSSGNAAINKVTAGTAADTISIPITLNSNIVITNTSTGSLNFTGIISGFGGLTKEGTGVLTSNNFNTYSGDTVINGGTIALNSNSVNIGIPDGAGKGNLVVNSGATLTTTRDETVNGLSGNGTIGLGSANARTFTVGNNNVSSTFSGVLQNNGPTGTSALTFRKFGSGVTTLNGTVTNTYTGGTAVNYTTGTLRFDYSNLPASTNLVSTSSQLQMQSGTVELFGKAGETSTQTFASLALSTNQGTYNTIKLTPNNLQVSPFTVGNMNLVFSNGQIARAIGSTVNFVIPANATITSGTALSVTDGLLSAATAVTGGTTGIRSAFAVLNGSTWASTSLSGTEIIGLDNGAYAKSSDISLQNSASGYNSLAGTLRNVDIESSHALDGAITINTLRFNTSGPKTLTLTGTNILDAGGILLTSAIGANPTVITGGTLTGNAGGLQQATVGVTPAADLIVHQYNENGSLTIASEIVDGPSGITALTKTGPGTLILSNGSNSYSGVTFLAGGKVVVEAANAIPHGAGKGSVITNGTLDLNGFDTIVNGINNFFTGKITNSSISPVVFTVGDNNGAVTYNTDSALENGVGGISVVKIGTGAFTSSSAVTYSGGTSIQGGPTTANFDSTATSGPLGTGTVTFNGTTLTLNFSNALQNNTLINNVNTSGLTAGLILSSAVTSNSFTLGGLSGTGSIVLANNATTPAPIILRVGNNNYSTAAYSGILSGAGSVAKIGSGTTILSGANTYTGNTTVAGGTLDISGSHQTGANYLVNASANLIANNIRVTNALTIDGTATINANGGTAGASKVETFAIGVGGKLNLKDNDLVVGTAANVNAVLAAIKTGVAGAVGITSDLPAFGVSTGFGYALGNDAAISPLLAGSLTGQSYDADSVLVKYTFLGDADLDGDSDLNDLGLWAQSFTGDLGNPAIPATFWTSGDFDYDGDTDLNDLGFWAGTFTGDLGGGAGSLIVVAPNAPAGAVAALNSMGITVVPEPSAIGLALLSVLGFCRAVFKKSNLQGSA